MGRSPITVNNPLLVVPHEAGNGIVERCQATAERELSRSQSVPPSAKGNTREKSAVHFHVPATAPYGDTSSVTLANLGQRLSLQYATSVLNT